jgi:hypothetical protein
VACSGSQQQSVVERINDAVKRCLAEPAIQLIAFEAMRVETRVGLGANDRLIAMWTLGFTYANRARQKPRLPRDQRMPSWIMSVTAPTLTASTDIPNRMAQTRRRRPSMMVRIIWRIWRGGERYVNAFGTCPIGMPARSSTL